MTAGQTYWYYLTDVDVNGARTEHREFVRSATSGATATIPTAYGMTTYPNPFNPSTTITFTLLESQTVQLAVYDVTGRQVRELVDGACSLGMHHVIFDAAGLPSGVYIAQIRSGSYAKSEKLLLLK